MAAILDFSKFTFSAEEIRAVKELVFDEVIASPEIEMLHTVYPGIVYDREIGFIGEGGLVGVAGQGCDPEPQGYNIGTRIVKWEPKSWEILIHQCAKDIEDTAAIYSMKTGVQYDDFSSSDYMAIILEVLAKSIKEFIIRLIWFSDTDAANTIIEELPTALATEQTTGSAIVGTVYAGVTSATSGAVKCALANKTIVYLAAAAATGNAVADTVYYSKDTVNKITIYSGGEITPGVDVDYFNIIDGLFKQMLVQTTVNANQLVSITENDAATYTLQELDPEKVLTDYLPKIYYKANILLRQNANKYLLCTQSVFDAYEQSLDGMNIESMYVNITDGIRGLKYKGLTLFPMPIWDKIILAYYNNGVRLVNPHRIVLSTKDVLAVGVDSTSSFGEMDVWYNKDQRKVKIEAKGKADAKLTNPLMFQLGI